MATYINNNVKFHGFSKSPVSPDTTLGGAVNPSGHTITTSQVRSQDIPAFLNTFQGTEAQARTWLSTNYAEPVHNDIAYYGGEFKAGFSTPKCLKYNANTSAWETFDLVNAGTLKNADDVDVIKIHQNCTTVFVDGGNNAATNSNRWSLFVKRADGTILDHFVASTDKIAGGMPSLGYNALVLWNGAAIDEGELDANYVGNTFSGIIHLNKQYANGDDAKFKVTCFEYIGEKLDKKVSDLTKAVFGEGSGSGEDLSLAQQVANNTTAISTLNANASTPGSVAHSVAAGVTSANSHADQAAATAKSEAISDATGKINTLGGQTLAKTSTGSTQVTVTTAGSVATGLTSITVSTSDIASANELSQLKSKVEQHLTDAAGKLEINVVDTLPTTGEAGKIYLVPNAKSADKNVKDEYIWVNNAWELIGSTQIDLSAYATTESVTSAINSAKTEIKGTTDGLANRIGTLETAAPSYALKATSLAASDTDEAGLVTVTTTGSLESGLGLTVTTTGIATAQSVSTLSTLVGQNTTAASNAQAAADAAQGAADAAQTTANQAVQAAANAQSAAGSAQSAADTAQTDATQALEDAEAAQSTADQAVAAAATADGKAVAAATAAANAQTAAEGAQATADAKISAVTGGGNGITVTTDNATKAVTVSVGAINAISDTNANAETVVTAKAVTAAIAAQASKDAAAYAAKSTETTASTALANAATAQSAAEAADAKAAGAAAAAKTADDKAVAAQTTANEAKTAAATADGKAVAAGTAAANAQKDATQALADAAAAQTKADEAYALADAATTVDEATAIAKAAADVVAATVPTTYVEDVNGKSGKVEIKGDRTSAAAIPDVVGHVSIMTDYAGICILGEAPWKQVDTASHRNVSKIIQNVGFDAAGNKSAYLKLHLATELSNIADCEEVITDLPLLESANGEIFGSNVRLFRGSLDSLKQGIAMFRNCKLDSDSVMYIADGIKDWGTSPADIHNITIHVDSTLTSDTTVAGYLTEIAGKGWTVASNHTAAAATAANGKTDSAVYVIARPCDEKRATHTTKDGKFVAVEVAKSVIGPHQHLWSIYTSKADAILDMELTAI